MAKNDVRIPLNFDHGPFIFMKEFALTAASAFTVGEPVRLMDTGRIAISVDDAAASSFLGIAQSSGDTVGTVDPVGTFRKTIGQRQVGASPNLPQTADMVKVAVCLPGAELECLRFARDGAGTTVTPVETDIGDTCNFTLVAGVWVPDSGNTGANEFLRVIGLLDANGENVSFSGRTAVGVRLLVLSSQASLIAAAP